MKQFLFLYILLVAFSAKSQTVGLLQQTSDSYAGYTLFAPMSDKKIYLVDNCGFEINIWESDYIPGLAVYMLDDGSIIYTGKSGSDIFTSGGQGGIIERRDWDNNLLWQYTLANDTIHAHHDIEIMPNGNILILAWEYKSNAEAIAAGRDPATFEDDFWPTLILEIEPIGTDSINIVWEWHFWDHIVQDFDANQNNFGVVADHPELLDVNYSGPLGGTGTGYADWIHANSIDYHPELDQIVLSSRNLSEFYIIDHSTTSAEAASHTGGNAGKGGDILYRWGNPQVYDRGTANDRKLWGQHDVQWVPSGFPDEGKILLFNNGDQRLYSTIEMLEPPLDVNDNYIISPNTAFGPTNYAWIYEENPNSDFYSDILSGASQLPNGNILACEGTSGRLLEIDLQGNIVWEYINPVGQFGVVAQGIFPNGNELFKAEKLPLDHPAFADKDMSPGSVLELNPFPSDCTVVSNENMASGLGLEAYYSALSDKVVIKNPDGLSLSIQVFDVLGHKLRFNDMYQEQVELNLQSKPKGTYFLIVQDKDSARYQTLKFFKP